MGKISTHVLDTVAGIPAAAVRIRLFRDGRQLADVLTNPDGRCDAPLIENPASGGYELRFSIGAYFRARHVDSPFLDEISIHFNVVEGESYHVPLLVSPWAYSTYRGS